MLWWCQQGHENHSSRNNAQILQRVVMGVVGLLIPPPPKAWCGNIVYYAGCMMQYVSRARPYT